MGNVFKIVRRFYTIEQKLPQYVMFGVTRFTKMYWKNRLRLSKSNSKPLCGKETNVRH